MEENQTIKKLLKFNKLDDLYLHIIKQAIKKCNIDFKF